MTTTTPGCSKPPAAAPVEAKSPTTPATDQSEVSPRLEANLYHDSKTGYSIQLPPHWMRTAEAPNVFVRPKLAPNELTVEHLRIDVSTDLSPDPITYLEKLIPQVRAALANFEEIERWGVMIDGRPGVAMEYTYGGLLGECAIMYIATDGNRYGIIVYNTFAHNIDDLRDENEKSALTFRFDTSTAPGSPAPQTAAPAQQLAPRKHREMGPVARRLHGHHDGVSCLAFSPDGTQIATGSFDQTIRIWDVATGQSINLLKGHSKSISHLVYSSDGKRIASSSFDQTVRVWNVANGKTIHTLSRDGKDFIYGVAISPDGTLIAANGDNYAITLWDAVQGQFLREFQGHTNAVRFIDFSSDGKTLVSAFDDKIIRYWDIASGKELRQVTIPEMPSNGYSFRTDFSQLLFVPEGELHEDHREIETWDILSEKKLRTFEVDTASVERVTCSADGKYLAAACRDRSIRILDPETGKQIVRLQGIQPFVMQMSLSPDGKFFAAACLDNTVKVWDLPSKPKPASTNPPTSNDIVSITAKLAALPPKRQNPGSSPENGATTNSPDKLDFEKAPELMAERILQLGPFETLSPDIVLSPDGRYVAVKGDDNSIIEVDSKKVVRKLTAKPQIVDFQFLPTSNRIVYFSTIGYDSTPDSKSDLIMGLIDSDQQDQTIVSAENAIQAFAVLGDVAKIATIHHDGKLKMRDPKTKMVLWEQQMFPPPLPTFVNAHYSELEFSNDGQYLAVYINQHEPSRKTLTPVDRIAILNVTDGKTVAEIPGDSIERRSNLTAVKEKATFLTAQYRGITRFSWGGQTEEQLNFAPVKTKEFPIRMHFLDTSFSDSGRYAVVRTTSPYASDEHWICVVDVQERTLTGKFKLTDLKGHSSHWRGISDDGKRIAFSQKDQHVSVWQIK